MLLVTGLLDEAPTAAAAPAAISGQERGNDVDNVVEVANVGQVVAPFESDQPAGHTWTCRDTRCRPCSFRSTPRSPGPRSELAISTRAERHTRERQHHITAQ